MQSAKNTNELEMERLRCEAKKGMRKGGFTGEEEVQICMGNVRCACIWGLIESTDGPSPRPHVGQ